MPVAENNPVTIQGAELGRYLFYDPILSVDSTFSCSSCHKQQYAFSDSPRPFSRGIKGHAMSRNTPALYNLAWYPSYFWDGRANSIEEQVFHPVREYNEMNLDWSSAAQRLARNPFYKTQFKNAFDCDQIDSTHIAKAIAQFMRTLVSYQSKYDAVLSGAASFTTDEYDGFVLVNDQTKGDCIHCHATDGAVLGTSLIFSNNGLDATHNPLNLNDIGRAKVTNRKEDIGKFKVPSLRNLAFTSPYMHDGRFKTLEEVIDFYSEGVKNSATLDARMQYAHRGGVKLSAEEKVKIKAFLLTLSDSTFITNPEFSNPF
jgi:cytochrome c peroxidase